MSMALDIVAELQDLPRQEWSQRLAEMSLPDDIRLEIERMLRFDQQAEDFLEHRPSVLRAIVSSTALSDGLLRDSGDEALGMPDAGQTIGSYRILERIGTGGMGVVFKAEQLSPIRRTVAIKVIKAGVDTVEVIERFEAERQALAWMDHPSIARVFDAGSDAQGRPYFVMEYVDGVAITTYCDENRLGVRARLELFIHVCDAVAHAHSKAIIHRDIKPSNVLAFTGDGKAMVKVIDFGVAKALVGGRLNGRPSSTMLGQAIGSYESMSPEQADGSADVDTRSDVYSLGTLLYEILCGAKPFDLRELGKVPDVEVRRIIREVDPPRPSRRLLSIIEHRGNEIAAARCLQRLPLARKLQSELDWIPLMALKKDRARRYPSPIELANDIRNYLSDRPLRARPDSLLYRAKMTVRRNKVAALFCITLMVLGAASLAVYNYGMRQEQRRTEAALATAIAMKQEADLQRATADEAAYSAAISAADGAIDRGDLHAARQWLLATPRSFRNWEWRYLLSITDPALLTIRDASRTAALSRDGERIATLSAVNRDVITIWDSDTGRLLQRLPGQAGPITSLNFSPSRNVLVMAVGNEAQILDLDTGQVTQTLRGHVDRVYITQFSPNGRDVLTTSRDLTAGIWDAASGQRRLTL